MKYPTFALLMVLVFVVTTGFTFQTSHAQANDNTNIAIAALGKDVNNVSGVGTVYVYDGADGSLLRIVDNPDGSIHGQFGESIIHKDNKLVIAAPWKHNDENKPEGAVYVLDGITESLQKTIPTPDPNVIPVDGFGASMAFVGNNFVIGAPNHGVGNLEAAGAVYVFDGNTGNLLQTINNPNPNYGDIFGASVTSLDDNTIIGIPGKKINNVEVAGAVSIFDASGSLIRTIDNPVPTDHAKFGWHVAAQNGQMLVGAPYAKIGNNDRIGTAYVFDSKTGSLLRTIDNPDPDEQDDFGFFVVFAENKIIVGSPGNGLYNEGTVYVFDFKTGSLLKTIDNPQKIRPTKFGITNEFGSTMAYKDGKLAIGDRGKIIDGVTNAGGVYVYDTSTWNLLQTIDNPDPVEDDSFGNYVTFVGKVEPSQEDISKMTEKQESAQTELSETKQNSDSEVWVEPKSDTVSNFIGTLQYDKIQTDFKCDIFPKIDYQYVDKTLHPEYPDHDSLFMRIGGEDTSKDFQIVFSLWDERDNAYAKDLSYHILLKNQDGSDRMGAIYSPDAYSDYSTLGVAVEANSKASKDGAIPSDVEKKFTELFGRDYILPVLMPPNSNYELYVRVFDSENDWISTDTCGVQAIMPIMANEEDNVTVGKIQFSNILVSAIETNQENLEESKKIINDAVANKNKSVESDQNSEPNVADETKTEYISPLRQFKAGVQIDKIKCRQGLELIFKDSDNSPSCVRLETKSKLTERGWTKPKQISTEISSETRLKLVEFLEGGQVSEFNALRKNIVGFLLLEGVDASGLDLSGINLENTGLPEADLHDAILDGAKMHKAKLLKANLQDANLDGANLQNADLENANLKGVFFYNTNLQGVKNFPISIEKATSGGIMDLTTQNDND